MALAATPVGSLSPASPRVMLDGTHGYANRQMLQRLLRPDEDVRRRMEEKETPRWGQRAKAADGRWGTTGTMNDVAASLLAHMASSSH